MEYDFCSVCGGSYEPTPQNIEGFHILHRLRFTLIHGSVVCHDCWKTRKRE